jgi:adenosylmethionine-8-amino-7-oxononanoate aminotransferase
MTYSEKDKAFVWHPYSQEKTAGDNIIIVKGEGTYLFDEQGNRYIDAVSSWWTNLHGHAHPHIAKRISEQAHQLEQVIFAGFSHPSAIELAEKLLQLLPRNQAKIFYSDNGSTAVEAAIKMALQYWNNSNLPKTKIIAFKDAYHGDTFGAMSVSARGVFTEPFHRLLFDVEFIETPLKGKEEESIASLKAVVAKYPAQIAAFIFEPLVLGSAGMLMYSSEVLEKLVSICQENNILTIADEVMTGFGRTGKFFASERLKTAPDILCMSKGITGGFLPFAATSCTQKIYDAFYKEDKKKMLFHGHSYTGNPLGCAAALASLEVFENEKTLEKIQLIEQSHQRFLAKISLHPAFAEVRQWGTILALEIKTATESGYLNQIRDNMYQFFIERKILLRPLGNVLYILPPYCISLEDLETIYNAIEEFAEITQKN